MSKLNTKLNLIKKIKKFRNKSKELYSKIRAIDDGMAKAITELEGILAAEQLSISKKLTTAQIAEAYLESHGPSTVTEVTVAAIEAGISTTETSVRSLLARRSKQGKQFYRTEKNTYDLIKRKTQ